ncbi:hypothetical protein J2Y74_001366 [Pseudomonas migulae]|uniref:contact-dependent growth inhibition system immunity protein n=1 Tax=Pseudomonas migulae TaxID=78543 RepID=UPI0020A21F44|nr:contact-dependent growth inhibition system immunity protein [Pseudomonas migulae]MCP1517056.1 hypothetical protein [Pseudomonas migulae]
MKKTFRSVAKENNSSWQPEAEMSSLTQWYLSIRDIPLEDLQMEDLCRAVRQELFISDLLPIVVSTLEKDLLSGFIDDGELLEAVSRLSPHYWSGNIILAKKMMSLLLEGEDDLAVDPNAVKSASVLKGKLLDIIN